MKKKVLVIILIVIAVATLAYRLARRDGPGDGQVAVSGNIEVTDVEVSFKIPGRVRERLVDEGETVKAGQVVARLDAEDRRLEVAREEQQVEVLAANPLAGTPARTGNTFSFPFDGGAQEASDLLEELVRAGVRVAHFGRKKEGIEEVYLRVGTREVS